VGDTVLRTMKPFSLELGPGLIGSIYDGLQRPLQTMYEQDSKSVFVPKGIDIPPLDKDAQYYFEPFKFKVGDHIVGGDIFGKVKENALFVHCIMLPPDECGTITFIAPADNYTLQV
jgi:V-type H+-transporting ATPase subunit A